MLNGTAPSDLRPELSAMSDQLGRLVEDMQHVAANQSALDRAHERLAHHEQEQWLQQFILPLTRKVAGLIQHVSEQRCQLERVAETVPADSQRHQRLAWHAKSLHFILVELESLLERFGIEAFACESSTFERSRQEAVERIDDGPPRLNGQVARRVAPGYCLGDRILIPERVAVHVTRLREIPGHRS